MFFWHNKVNAVASSVAVSSLLSPPACCCLIPVLPLYCVVCFLAETQLVLSMCMMTPASRCLSRNLFEPSKT